LSASYHEEVAGSVAEYMNPDVQVVDADDSVMEVTELFLKWHYHRFPVMDENRLVGVISQHDVLRALETLWGTGA
jgi:CBS domain-containing protein